jgi:hypothetical protein
MRTLKNKHKNEFSYSIAEFIKNKSITYDKTKVQYNKSKPTYAKKSLNGSKSTSQCRKINPTEKLFIGSCLADMYSTTEKHALQKISENDPLTGSIKRNRTMTNMIVHQPKGDNDETSERQSKQEAINTPKTKEHLIEEKENHHDDCDKWANEIRGYKSLKTEDRHQATLQTLAKLYNCNNPLSQLIKEVCNQYEDHFKYITDEHKKSMDSMRKNEATYKAKLSENELEKVKLLKEIKLQQKHIEAQTIVIDQLQTCKMQSEAMKTKILKLTEQNEKLAQTIHNRDKNTTLSKKSGVPSLDLSKIQKKQSQLSLIIKPSYFHHSLSSDSEEGDDIDKQNKTTIAEIDDKAKEVKAPKVPKLNLYYLKKSM